MVAHIVQRELLGGTGQAEHQIFQQALTVGIGHRGMAAGCFLDHLGRKILCSTGPGEDVDVKGRKVDQIESHAQRPIWPGPFQIGPGPIEHGHEVIADHFDPGIGKVVQAGLPVGDVRPPLALLFLDRLGYRQAFHYLPRQPGRGAIFHPADQRLPGGDFIGGPHGPGRHMMQG